jgi:hypothetical protein
LLLPRDAQQTPSRLRCAWPLLTANPYLPRQYSASRCLNEITAVARLILRDRHAKVGGAGRGGGPAARGAGLAGGLRLLARRVWDLLV